MMKLFRTSKFTTILLLLFFATAMSAMAQDIQGVVRYETLVNLDKQHQMLKDPATPLNEKQQTADYIRFMKNTFEQSYTLTFTSRESIYEVEEQLGLGTESDQGKDTQDNVYKNFAEGIYITKRDVVGKIYMVSEALPNFQWKMHDETKQIGDYTCHKATYAIMHEVEENVQNPDGSFELKLTRKEITKTAWYCPALPIMNGPAAFGGLPGLILEVSDDSNPLIIRCTEITINDDKKVNIKRPKARRFYTEEAYREVLKSL